MRHAYLVLAHSEFEVLKTLVRCLDDERNDIFIHFDKKVKSLPDLKVRDAGLFILDKRVDVNWAGFSMVKAEERLFEAAVSKGPYKYYHLISGVDLPLKSQDYIHDFFSRNEGKEFVEITDDCGNPAVEHRMRRWHFFEKSFRDEKSLRNFFYMKLLALLIRTGVQRNRKMDFHKGSQWVSVTDSMARYFLSRRKWIRKVFRHTFAPDECVFQTLCHGSSFLDSVYRPDKGQASLRLVNWSKGHVYVKNWTADDYGALEESPMIFARKFTGSDPDFIKEVARLSSK